MEILPAATTVSTVTGALFDVVAANIVPVLGVLGVAWGIKYSTRFFNKSTRGKL